MASALNVDRIQSTGPYSQDMWKFPKILKETLNYTIDGTRAWDWEVLSFKVLFFHAFKIKPINPSLEAFVASQQIKPITFL